MEVEIGVTWLQVTEFQEPPNAGQKRKDSSLEASERAWTC